MNKLNLPETVINEKYGITIRPYLTAEEIGLIAYTLKDINDYMERVITKDRMVLKFTTDMTPEEYNGDYDLLRQSGLIDEVNTTGNIDYDLAEVDRFLEQIESMNFVLGSFLNVFNHNLKTLIDKVPDKDKLTGLTENLGNLVTMANKKGGANLINMFKGMNKSDT